MNSRASLMTITKEHGTMSDMTIGTNSSSKVLTANTNLGPDTLSSNTRKSSLTTTNNVTTPRMKPRINFNSAASTLKYRDGEESCGNLTGDTLEEAREPIVFDTPRS